MIRGFSHISVAVTDMEAALGFYRDVLGLTVSADWIQELWAAKSAELSGPRDIRRRCVWLRWQDDNPDGGALALDQMLSPVPADRRSEIYDLGIHHFAFWVDDIDAVIAKARAAGVTVIKPHTANTKDYGEAKEGQIRSVFFRDPDKNLVQCDMRVR